MIGVLQPPPLRFFKYDLIMVSPRYFLGVFYPCLREEVAGLGV